ncbi:MAG: hypothetical protein ACRDNJ_07590, partial [Solirubrobacteraceae bacterium]
MGEPEAEATHVIAFATLGAAERRRRLPGRARSREVASRPDPAPVATGRATVIDVARPLSDRDAAHA